MRLPGTWMAVLLAAGTFAACADRGAFLGVPAPAAVPVQLDVSAVAALPGSRVAVAVRVTGGPALAGLQGELRFDPARLHYLGQSVDSGIITAVNADGEGDGRLRLLSLDLSGAGLRQRSVVLVFGVREPDYAASLAFRLDLAATRDLVAIRPASRGRAVGAPDLAVPADARRLSVADWYDVLAPGLAARERAAVPRVPGQYVPSLRYGDATLNGVINVLDAAAVANLAVGNRPLLTDTTKDYVIAANVAPANLPGLGEEGDSLPPGRNADGSFGIDVLDAAGIANEGIGNDRPIVGELIPGREPLPSNRVVLTGALAANRTLFRDTIYQLDGLVIVPGGDTLTIQAGTRIEGDSATRGTLAVYRGGIIIARGTRLQPIVMTCTAALKTRGCWGGLVINGLSLLNNGEVPPDGWVDPCPQKIYPTTPDYAGGCLIQSSSGVLRYLRVEWAGMAAGQAPVPGLSLLAVGSGTVVDSVQVSGSLGDGLFVGGGTVDLRSIVLTDNARDGLRWEDGWVGRAQFLFVQQGAVGRHAIHGSNATGDPDAGPRSNPLIYHVTVVGPPPGRSDAGSGLYFEQGTAATIGDALILRAGVSGLEIQDTATCVQASGGAPGLLVTGAIFFGSPRDFSDDADCVDEAAYALLPARANRVADPLLAQPFLTASPDLRLLTGSPALTGYVAPPTDGFFDQSSPFVGAVGTAGSGAAIPWYAGWTRGF